jgi:YebC/PmpR family DNA-binding regulatory protein
MYEGYGPAGVALLIHCFTDNRNRTGSDVRSILSKNGGSLGEPGSVAYVFEKKGTIVVSEEKASEDDLMVAIDAGAEDILEDGEFFEVVTEPTDFVAVREAIEAANIAVESAGVSQRPKTRVPVADEDAAKVFRVIDLLEENDDVNDVAANFEVSDAALEALAAE